MFAISRHSVLHGTYARDKRLITLARASRAKVLIFARVITYRIFRTFADVNPQNWTKMGSASQPKGLKFQLDESSVAGQRQHRSALAKYEVRE